MQTDSINQLRFLASLLEHLNQQRFIDQSDSNSEYKSDSDVDVLHINSAITSFTEAFQANSRHTNLPFNIFARLFGSPPRLQIIVIVPPGSNPNSNNSDSLFEIFTDFSNSNPNANRCTDPEVIQKLKFHNVVPSNQIGTDFFCTICQEGKDKESGDGGDGDDDGDEKNKEDSSVVKLPCDHLFHFCCIEQWLKLNNKCPACKFEFFTTDTKYNETVVETRQDQYRRLIEASAHRKYLDKVECHASSDPSRKCTLLKRNHWMTVSQPGCLHRYHSECLSSLKTIYNCPIKELSILDTDIEVNTVSLTLETPSSCPVCNQLIKKLKCSRISETETETETETRQNSYEKEEEEEVEKYEEKKLNSD